MRFVALTAPLLLVSGCMSMRPVEQPSDAIQHAIESQGLLMAGDKVRIVTADGAVHEFRVDAVDLEAGRVLGEKTDIDIASITTLELKKFSSWKTGLLAGLVVLGLLDTECEGDPCGEFGGGPYCCS
jgi:hypothetical protein